MAHRRVICDSEDEDGGGEFSDLDNNNNSPARHHDGGEQRPPEHPNSDSRSTDPDFFRRIYEDQQKYFPNNIPDTLTSPQQLQQPMSSSPPVSKQQQKSSSSLTDPTTLSRRSLKTREKKKKKQTTEPKELANMTQVTTPDAPVTGKRKDIYDFDFSDEEGASTAAKPKFKATKSEASANKDGKRKRSTPKAPFEEADAQSASSPRFSMRAHGSSATRPIEVDDDDDKEESRGPTRKKRKSGDQKQTAREIPDDVDLLVIPTTADVRDTPAEMNEGEGNLGSIINDTFEAPQNRSDPVSTSSLIIVPPSLTASQKQQYLRVSGSSELDQNKFGGTDGQQQQASLPALKSQTQGLRSTNTESTIPYTTPSRYGSSLAPLGGVEGQNDHNVPDLSSERRTQLDMVQPDCSPDELSAHPVEIMSRATKRKSPTMKKDEPSEDDAWISDNIGFSRGNYVPRPSKKRSRTELKDDDDEVAAQEQSMPDTCPPGHAPSETSEHAQEVTSNEALATQGVDMEGLDPDFLAAMPDDIRQEIINNHKPAGNKQTARTRSRARPTEASSGPLPTHEETPQPKKRGRKKKLPATDDLALVADEPAAQPSPAPLALAKRKRGRPKKSEAAPAPVIEEDQRAEDESGLQAEIAEEARMKELLSIEDTQVTLQATKPTRRRGRKKKTGKENAEVVQEDVNESVCETEDVSGMAQEIDGTLDQNPEPPTEDASEGRGNGGREALRDISNTVVEKPPGADHADSGVDDKDATPASKKSKDSSKPASTPSQLHKVRYRVGLSKKSSITPLLKSIRK